MSRLTSKEWFVAVKNGVIMANENGYAIMAKTKTNVERDVLSVMGFYNKKKSVSYKDYGIDIRKITARKVEGE